MGLSQSNPFFTTIDPLKSRAAQWGLTATIGPPDAEYEDENPYSNQACTLSPCACPSSIHSCSGSRPANRSRMGLPIRLFITVLGYMVRALLYTTTKRWLMPAALQLVTICCMLFRLSSAVLAVVVIQAPRRALGSQTGVVDPPPPLPPPLPPPPPPPLLFLQAMARTDRTKNNPTKTFCMRRRLPIRQAFANLIKIFSYWS